MYSPTESLLGALLLALPCLKLVGNGRRNKNPANARFGLGLFQNEHARVALQALRVEEEDVFCSRDFMAVLSTRWSSFSIMMDAVPAVKIMYAEEISGSDNAAALISEKAAQYSELQASAMAAARRGYVDDIIDAADTRKRVIAAMEMLFTKREDRPAKKHGTV